MNDDISATLAPKSDQLDAIDLMGKPPQVFTVTRVDVKANPDADQPVSVHLAEFPRVWRPNVNMRRVLGYCWGTKSSAWIGRQVELYCDADVRFGDNVTGGTRISRLSHIKASTRVPLLLSQGRSGTWKVDPLPATEQPTKPAKQPDAPEPTEAEVTACTDQAKLREMYQRTTSEELKALILQRKADLENEPGAA